MFRKILYFTLVFFFTCCNSSYIASESDDELKEFEEFFRTLPPLEVDIPDLQASDGDEDKSINIEEFIAALQPVSLVGTNLEDALDDRDRKVNDASKLSLLECYSPPLSFHYIMWQIRRFSDLIRLASEQRAAMTESHEQELEDQRIEYEREIAQLREALDHSQRAVAEREAEVAALRNPPPDPAITQLREALDDAQRTIAEREAEIAAVRNRTITQVTAEEMRTSLMLEIRWASESQINALNKLVDAYASAASNSTKRSNALSLVLRALPKNKIDTFMRAMEELELL